MTRKLLGHTSKAVGNVVIKEEKFDVKFGNEAFDINKPIDLPFRAQEIISGDDLAIRVHPLSSKDAILVSISPPKQPKEEMNHVFSDIVLVIDISGSMAAAAPLPGVQDKNERESAGLSILDLTKHAARTVLQTMEENDRLGIVTFSTEARIVQPLTYMTKAAKVATFKRIDKLSEENSTNLWAGIRFGLNLFENATEVGNVQGLFVLTDGMPNHMCPPQGYVTKLKPMLSEMSGMRSQVPSIHTFGFGYGIRSELMQSIAEAGNGNYAFIPDAGMIGTVFVHAVANLYSTLGTATTLTIQTSSKVKLSSKCAPGYCSSNGDVLILNLGNLQYGQTRDIIFEIESSAAQVSGTVDAFLNFVSPSGERHVAYSSGSFLEFTSLPQNTIQYHLFRTEICNFLSTLFPLDAKGEHTQFTVKSVDRLADANLRLVALIEKIQKSPVADDANINSLLEDLFGDEPIGQVSKALEEGNWQRWGRHYLPSLLHAHLRQVCNSFKDPGPLRYGAESPLFVKCRNELDAAFDNLPPPKPSRKVYSDSGHLVKPSIVHMNRYNSSSNACFEGQCKVKMGDGSALPVMKLQSRMQVWTPVGVRDVVAIIKTKVGTGAKQPLCRVGKLWVTPWHPLKDGSDWVFPLQIADGIKASRRSVYSVLLAPSSNPDAHAIEVGGQVCVTLGHGILENFDGVSDVRAHAFFGNYALVLRSLSRLTRDGNGHLRCHGLHRNRETGLTCGFAGSMTMAQHSAMRARGPGLKRLAVRG